VTIERGVRRRSPHGAQPLEDPELATAPLDEAAGQVAVEIHPVDAVALDQAGRCRETAHLQVPDGRQVHARVHEELVPVHGSRVQLEEDVLTGPDILGELDRGEADVSDALQEARRGQLKGWQRLAHAVRPGPEVRQPLAQLASGTAGKDSSIGA
jgi:hypothetical protein